MRSLTLILMIFLTLMTACQGSSTPSEQEINPDPEEAVFEDPSAFLQFALNDSETATITVDVFNKDLSQYAEEGCLMVTVEGIDRHSWGSATASAAFDIIDEDVSPTPLDYKPGANEDDYLSEIKISDSYLSFEETIDIYLYYEEGCSSSLTLLAHIQYP